MVQYRDVDLLHRIAFKIKELREARGVSQEQFYFDTRVHIGRIETAKVNISISTLIQICRYLNISLSEFVKDLE